MISYYGGILMDDNLKDEILMGEIFKFYDTY